MLKIIVSFVKSIHKKSPLPQINQVYPNIETPFFQVTNFHSLTPVPEMGLFSLSVDRDEITFLSGVKNDIVSIIVNWNQTYIYERKRENNHCFTLHAYFTNLVKPWFSDCIKPKSLTNNVASVLVSNIFQSSLTCASNADANSCGSLPCRRVTLKLIYKKTINLI